MTRERRPASPLVPGNEGYIEQRQPLRLGDRPVRSALIRRSTPCSSSTTGDLTKALKTSSFLPGSRSPNPALPEGERRVVCAAMLEIDSRRRAKTLAKLALSFPFTAEIFPGTQRIGPRPASFEKPASLRPQVCRTPAGGRPSAKRRLFRKMRSHRTRTAEIRSRTPCLATSSNAARFAP